MDGNRELFRKDSEDKLQELRAKIEELDQELFKLLAKRMAIALEIGSVKQELGIPVSDPVREALLKARLKEFASDVLEPQYVEQLASIMIGISRSLQEKGSSNKS